MHGIVQSSGRVGSEWTTARAFKPKRFSAAPHWGRPGIRFARTRSDCTGQPCKRICRALTGPRWRWCRKKVITTQPSFHNRVAPQVYHQREQFSTGWRRLGATEDGSCHMCKAVKLSGGPFVAPGDVDWQYCCAACSQLAVMLALFLPSCHCAAPPDPLRDAATFRSPKR